MKKCFDIAYKCFDIVYKCLILHMSVRLIGLNFYFYDAFFWLEKMVKKGYTRMKVFFAMGSYESAPG